MSKRGSPVVDGLLSLALSLRPGVTLAIAAKHVGNLLSTLFHEIAVFLRLYRKTVIFRVSVNTLRNVVFHTVGDVTLEKKNIDCNSTEKYERAAICMEMRDAICFRNFNHGFTFDSL